MPTYSVNAINVGSFNLGESDKVITLFSAERGLIRAVAKGARKPSSKIAGRADLLAVNKLLLANGKSFDIITQAESIESFKSVRNDLTRLSYALYYAELTSKLGQGLNQESELYFDMLIKALKQLSNLENNSIYLCLNFQLSLLHMLGLKPELSFCVLCRKHLVEYDLGAFHHEMGGVVCNGCFSNGITNEKRQKLRIAESGTTYNSSNNHNSHFEPNWQAPFTYLTPLVWKKLILAASLAEKMPIYPNGTIEIMEKTLLAARHLLETYIEHRAGKKMKSLELI